MRERGMWLGVLVGGVGLLLAGLVLWRGGGYFRLMHDLQWLVPLAVVGVVTALAASRLGGGQANPVLWFCVVVVGAIGWNFLAYSQKFGRGVFRLLLPVRHPTGLDFRDGLYLPGRAFTNADSGWPPFTLWIGKAFTALGFSTGYALQVVLLGGFAIGSAALCALLVRHSMSRTVRPGSAGDVSRAVETGAPPPFTALQLGVLGGLWLVTSYGFMYEMERGQVDLYALFFALLSVWLVVRRPQGSPWWPSLALALAVNIKAYPAVLAIVLLWRYRWRAVVPLLVTNVVLFLSAGPTNVRRFITTQSSFETSASPLWWGNNSAVSLGHTLHGLSTAWPSWLGSALVVVSALLWIATLVVVMRRGWGVRGAVLVAAACVPVMCTFPSISHDYKLVLLVFPLVVLAATTAARRRDGGPLWAVLFMAVAFEFFLLARSSLVIAPSLQASKFVLIVGLQVLLLIAGLLEERPAEARAEERGGDGNDERSGLKDEAARQGPSTEAPT